MVEPEPVIVRPFPPPAAFPLIYVGVPVSPGCEVPSIKTGPVIAGQSDTGSIVCTPSPGIAKSMTAPVPVARFADSMAARSDPGPPSVVVVTKSTESNVRSSITSSWAAGTAISMAAACVDPFQNVRRPERKPNPERIVPF